MATGLELSAQHKLANFIAKVSQINEKLFLT